MNTFLTPAVLKVAEILAWARANGMSTPDPERITRDEERAKLLSAKPPPSLEKK